MKVLEEFKRDILIATIKRNELEKMVLYEIKKEAAQISKNCGIKMCDDIMIAIIYQQLSFRKRKKQELQDREEELAKDGFIYICDNIYDRDTVNEVINNLQKEIDILEKYIPLDLSKQEILDIVNRVHTMVKRYSFSFIDAIREAEEWKYRIGKRDNLDNIDYELSLIQMRMEHTRNQLYTPIFMNKYSKYFPKQVYKDQKKYRKTY